jgi:hypothetical protein
MAVALAPVEGLLVCERGTLDELLALKEGWGCRAREAGQADDVPPRYDRNIPFQRCSWSCALLWVPSVRTPSGSHGIEREKSMATGTDTRMDEKKRTESTPGGG